MENSGLKDLRAISESDLKKLIDEVISLRLKCIPQGTCLKKYFDGYGRCMNEGCDVCNELRAKAYAVNVSNEIYSKTTKIRVI